MVLRLLRQAANIQFALAGILTIFKEEVNCWNFLVGGFAFIAVAFWLAFPAWSIAILLFAWVLTLSLEFLNSSIERLANVVQPNRSEHIRKIKDIAAAAVFLPGLFFVFLWAYLFFTRTH